MKTPSVVRRRNSLYVGLWAVALTWLGVAGCFHTADPSKLKCKSQAGCPNGYVCTTTGSCQRGGGNRDGSLAVGGAAGGANGSGGGAGGGGRDGNTDGLAGSTGNTDALSRGGAGGVGGSTGGSASGGAGSGGTSGGSGGISGGSGGISSPDAPGATGGTTSVPDASIAPDGTDAPAGLANGAPCTSNGQCASTFCIDGVCCATTCSGCSACSAALTGDVDGTCAPAATGKDPHDTCTDETATKPCGNDGTCDGKGACRKVASGQKCAAASCSADGNTLTPDSKCDGTGTCAPGTAQNCSPYQCAVTGCAKICTKQSDCDTGTFCDTTAGTCANQKTNGQPATQTSECASGIIADGVCCNDACAAACKACTSTLNGQATSTTGTCLAVTAAKATAAHSGCAAGTDPCGTNGTCDGVGSCHYPALGSDCGTPSCDTSISMLTKSTCSSSHTCTAGTPAACAGSMACASATTCKSGACSTEADCVSGYFCSGGTCTAKKNKGGACTATTQCNAGLYCVDGYCCNDQCAGNCQTCKASPGNCQATTTARSACGGSGCAAKKCDGSNADCVYVGSEVSCSATCNTDLTGYNQAACSGGVCGTATTHACNSGTYCSGGSCVGQMPVNTANCPANAACGTNNCSINASGTSGTMCCPQGQQNCSQGCYDLNSSSTHCGSCGTNCGYNTICSSRNCSCVGAQFTCGGCASWNFESNTTEGWSGASGLIATTERYVPASMCSDGTHSLKFPVTGSAGVSLSLCGIGNNTPTNVSGFSFYLFVATTSGTFTGTTSGELALIIDTDGNGHGTAIGPTLNSWYQVSSSFSTVSAASFTMNIFSSSAWSGNVYIDCVQFSP